MRATTRIAVSPIVASAIQTALVACTFFNPGAHSVTDSREAGESGGSGAGGSTASPGPCKWPASLDDAGPGACSVARAYVHCTYPSGVACEGGARASSPSGLGMSCLSDDLTSCSGCISTTGVMTCMSVCAANEYAVSCGGPPRPSPDGGFAADYQGPPDGCVGVDGTPAGNSYSCCPCQ